MLRVMLFALVSAVVTLPARAQDVSQALARLQARLSQLHAASNVPGVTAGIVLADGRTIALAAGFADTARRIPMTASTRLPSGSTGKTFVAAIVLQLVDEGKVGLDDPLARWFGKDRWFARLPNGATTTVRMLLNQTSGIIDHVIDRRFLIDVLDAPTRVWQPEEMVAYVLGTKPVGPAGSAFHYTDTNYILLGMIIERATGSSYYGELERRLLRPLALGGIVPNDRMEVPGVGQGYSGGLERAMLAYGKEAVQRVVAPGSAAAADAMLVGSKYVVNPQFEWTGGGLATTAVDLARWAKAVYEARAFPQPLLDEALKRPRSAADTGRYYGLGVGVSDTPLGPRWGHGGFYPGYRTVMAYYPKQRVAVVVQTNTTAEGATSFAEPFVAEAVELAAALGTGGREPAPSLAERLIGAWELVSTEQILTDGTRRPSPSYGERALGYLIYSEAGRMCAVLTDPSRATWKVRATPTMDELKAIADHYVGYCGRYQVNETEGSVVHEVELDAVPNAIGTKRKRYISLDGDTLRLRTAEVPPGVAEFRLTWRRVPR